MSAKRFELWYWVENGGDGSANTHFCTSEESATKKDEAQAEDGYGGWGESSVGSVHLEYEDGKLYLVGERFDYDDKTGKGETVRFRNELKRVSK